MESKEKLMESEIQRKLGDQSRDLLQKYQNFAQKYEIKVSAQIKEHFILILIII